MKVKIRKAPSKAKNGKLIPLTQDMSLFSGPSHEDGGIPYKGIEVEGGEPLYKNQDGSETVFGRMQIPGTKMKFKQAAKNLAEKEQKVDKLLSKGADLVNNYDWKDRWDELKFNAGSAMLQGAVMKKQELKSNKEHLANLQQALLETADQMGADPYSLSKGKIVKAKNGYRMKYDDGGKWDFRGTNKEGLDKKILDFVDLVVKKGYTGYSGPKSGYDVRNTKSGRKSRHASGQALDMIFDDPEVYQKILKDPELTSYLINNGLTAINEYNPAVKQKTGADVGHIHIGYDQGTPTSDSFRVEAKKLYGQSNPTWAWNTRLSTSGKPIKNAPAGDSQVEGYNTPLLQVFNPGKQKTATPRTITPGEYDLNVTEPTKKNIPSNAKGLDFYQIAPELVAFAQNKTEPVWMQQFVPELFQPTKVSFQDRLSENQTSFNSLQRVLGNNPEALATLAGQKYAADNSILGDEFRTNQQIEQDVTNRNISLLNDAQLKNLSLADTQYVRQNQAKSNTKALNNTILNSITGKIAQNEARNQALKYYESLTDYRFNPDSGQIEYMGDNLANYLSIDGETGNSQGGNTQTRQTYDKDGNLKSTTYTNPGWLDQAIKAQQYQQGQYRKLGTVMGQSDSITKFFNSYKKR